MTRREVLVAAATVAVPRRVGFTAFTDPLTETIVTRLTAPTSSSILPATAGFVSQKGRLLLFSGNQTGPFTPCLLDLRNATLVQLAEPSKLDPLSLTFDLTERNILFLDGGSLHQVSVATRRETKLGENIDAFTAGSSVFVFRGNRIEDLAGHVHASEVSGLGPLSPDGRSLLFRRGDELWYAQGSGLKRLIIGSCESPFWSADSSLVFYLDRTDPPRSVLKAASLDGTITEIAPTTQFATVWPNRDDSVFVGSSSSKAQPAVILLLRRVRRELVLCEHHASNPVAVRPAFSPDSKFVYFQTDRVGKPAIYRVSTEHFVEPT